MNTRHYNLHLCFCFAFGILFSIGCAPEIQKPTQVVPGKESITESLSILKTRSQNAVSLLARGRCVFEYYDQENKKRKKEQLAVIVLMKPPVEIYLQGDATFARKPIILGSNEREFWLLMSPKGISTYWWGVWSEQESLEGLLINPRTLFEALGFFEIGVEDNWSLSSKGDYDVLTQQNEGVEIKRMRISKLGYLISKIEYYDSEGRALAVAELNNYKEIAEGFFVPASIKIIAYNQDDGAEPLGITLNLTTIKPKEFNERQKKLFELPPKQGFDHILRNKGGKWIEESQ
jgi:hypothetical protein